MRESESVRDWEELVAYEPVLRTWLMRRCRDKSELDDVVQETMLRAARSRANGGGPRSVAQWLARIARNALHDWVRREGRARQFAEVERELDDLPQPECVCEATVRRADEVWSIDGQEISKELALEELGAMLDELGPLDRQLVDAYYGGGSTCADAARACGIPPERAKVRLYRVRQRLTRELARRVTALGRPAAATEG